MGTRLKFLGLAAFCAMVTFLGAAFLAKGVGSVLRHWFLLISGGVFCVLSLVGVIFPNKMKWILDGRKKKNGE